MFDDTPARATCIQQMNECAAAIRLFPERSYNMRIRLAALTRYAWNHGWLPECFEVDPELEVQG